MVSKTAADSGDCADVSCISCWGFISINLLVIFPFDATPEMGSLDHVHLLKTGVGEWMNWTFFMFGWRRSTSDLLVGRGRVGHRVAQGQETGARQGAAGLGRPGRQRRRRESRRAQRREPRRRRRSGRQRRQRLMRSRIDPLDRGSSVGDRDRADRVNLMNGPNPMSDVSLYLSLNTLERFSIDFDGHDVAELKETSKDDWRCWKLARCRPLMFIYFTTLFTSHKCNLDDNLV